VECPAVRVQIWPPIPGMGFRPRKVRGGKINIRNPYIETGTHRKREGEHSKSVRWHLLLHQNGGVT
jgi:hypothetical protein